jgi:integrating conjugative element protein (TIGR03752 family)
MSMVSSNRLLPLLAGLVLALTVVVAVKSCSSGDDGWQGLSAVPKAPTPDADTPADTIKTLTANVSAMTTEVRALRQENAGLKQDNQSLIKDRSQIENTVLSRLKQTLQVKTQESEKQRQAGAQRDASLIAELSARVDTLSQSLSGQHTYSTTAGNVSDIPVGLGLDGLASPAANGDAVVWVAPLEITSQPADEDGNLFGRLGHSTQRALSVAKPQGERLVSSSANVLNPATPVYTIPRNATLIGSTAMTALVGRVPVKGQVRDPMPFKVIAGKDNLAANGLTIPGVQGMIWSGTAIGDWTLSCVSGQLESVTFVFEDGTIQTLSSDDDSTRGSSGNSNKPLGWISDARGIPCISGERKTNAPAYLSQRIGAMAIEAAAQAAAQSETTTVVSDTGTASNSVTGDAGRYILGRTASGGSQELARWLRERQAQNFDAVFVPAGIELAIHVDHELPIDFHANGRKLHHGDSYGLHIPNKKTGTGLD